MAAVLRIKLADLLTVLASDLSPRIEKNDPFEESGPSQKTFTQLGFIGFRPRARPKKPAKPNMGSKIDEQELRAIQKYLSSGPASRDDLEFALSMTSSAVLYRLAVLKENTWIT